MPLSLGRERRTRFKDWPARWTDDNFEWPESVDDTPQRGYHLHPMSMT